MNGFLKDDSKMFFIRASEDSSGKDISIEYKEVLGYITEENIPRIMIKDFKVSEVYESPNIAKYYMPVEILDNSRCKIIKKGVYLNDIDSVMYCSPEELKFALDYYKDIVSKNIEEEITELQERINKLKNVEIKFKNL